jgi:phosphatidylserine/phosphatidylglycerophosphate/cardiolipin synthase-like enzyme
LGLGSDVSRRLTINATTLAASLTFLILVALFFVFQNESEQEAPLPTLQIDPESAWTVLFTDAGGPEAASYRGGPDAYLADAIDAARYSVDVAIYHLDLWSIRDALIRAHRRGLPVRLVVESDYHSEAEITELEQEGIEIIGDLREHLMHHKFVILDGMEVWTGSMNFTVRGAYINNNNLLAVRSSELAQWFTQEFEEMFLEDRFGALSLSDPVRAPVVLDDGEWIALFSPDVAVASELVELIDDADSTIEFMAFSFTSDEIAGAMLDRLEAGVRVRGVVESDQAAALGAQYEALREGGVDVRLDGNPGTMHHKVIILDGEIVICGSYNFTRSAEEHNDENLLIVADPDLAGQFLIEFEKIYAEGGL